MAQVPDDRPELPTGMLDVHLLPALRAATEKHNQVLAIVGQIGQAAGSLFDHAYADP